MAGWNDDQIYYEFIGIMFAQWTHDDMAYMAAIANASIDADRRKDSFEIPFYQGTDEHWWQDPDGD